MNSNTVEAPVSFSALPEQAQWELEKKHTFRLALEVWLTNIVAKNKKSVWHLTILTCLIPALLFGFIDAPFLYHYASPVLPWTMVALFAGVVVLFLVASFMDPGVVRWYHPKDVIMLENQLRNRNIAHYDSKAQVFHSDGPKAAVGVNRECKWNVYNHEIITTWCYHCKIYQPPRVHHCRLCGRCIERFDHHVREEEPFAHNCPWLDNCVGAKNYPWFILLLIMHEILWILWLSCCIVHIVLRCSLSWRNIAYFPATVVQVGIGSANLHFLSVLLSCQRDLMKLGLTVHEFKTDKYYNRVARRFLSPFHRGSFWRNLRDACCIPWSPSVPLPVLEDPRFSAPKLPVGTPRRTTSTPRVRKSRDSLQVREEPTSAEQKPRAVSVDKQLIHMVVDVQPTEETLITWPHLEIALQDTRGSFFGNILSVSGKSL